MTEVENKLLSKIDQEKHVTIKRRHIAEIKQIQRDTVGIQQQIRAHHEKFYIY